MSSGATESGTDTSAAMALLSLLHLWWSAERHAGRRAAVVFLANNDIKDLYLGVRREEFLVAEGVGSDG